MKPSRSAVFTALELDGSSKVPNTTSRRFYALNAPQQQISGQIASGATSVSVPSFTGWPTQFPFYAALEIGTGSLEIVSVTNIVGTTATIARGQRGTAAIAHPLGATIDMVAVDQDYDEANAHSSSTSGVHGVAGAVAGLTDVQTLTNKTLDKAKFTGDAGTEAIQSKATAVGGKVFSGRNSSNVEKSSITDAGVANLLGGANIGSAAQLTVDSVGNLATSGAVQGGTLAAVGAASVGAGLTVTGATTSLISFKQYANEAAAGTPATGSVVYLTAPTGSGYTAGLFEYTGTIWRPVQVAHDGFDAISGSPTYSTPINSTPTNATIANVTVPAWATQAICRLNVVNVLSAATEPNVSLQLLVGSAAGAGRRILGHSSATGRFSFGRSERVTGLTPGSQSVALKCQWLAGTSVFSLDANSYITVDFTFLP